MTRPASAIEVERQYRVAQMTLDAHACLRDRYARRAKTAKAVLLAASAVFCATTFASADLYAKLGFDAGWARIILGILAVGAFVASVLLLVLDWEGQTALHSDAVRRWSSAVASFRQSRAQDGLWPQEDWETLGSTYWRACAEAVPIPHGSFNALKSRYLQKRAISELKSKYPGSPRVVLGILIKARDTARAIKDRHALSEGGVSSDHIVGAETGQDDPPKSG